MSAYKYYEENDDREEKMNHFRYDEKTQVHPPATNGVAHDPYMSARNEEFENLMVDVKSTNRKKINYKYKEDKILQEIAEYIDGTYGEHYSKGKIQSTEIAIDRGRGLHFCLGNVDKYSGRYGQKGTPEDWRKDLMKVVHYGIITLFIHDLEHNKED